MVMTHKSIGNGINKNEQQKSKSSKSSAHASGLNALAALFFMIYQPKENPLKPMVHTESPTQGTGGGLGGSYRHLQVVDKSSFL